MENTQDITALRYIVCTDKGVETKNYQMMVRGLTGAFSSLSLTIACL